MNRMNPEIKARWVAALRSGEYEQTAGFLRNDAGGFCCLGVLCDLYAKERGLGDWDARLLGHDGVAEEPCNAVRDWAGLSERNPYIAIAGLEGPASNHNDGSVYRGSNRIICRSFSEIADAIEAQL